MPNTPRRSSFNRRACALLLALLAAQGCATRLPAPDVGAVVVTPKLQLPPPPQVVQQTAPLPAGYFQQSLSDFFSPKPKPPTP